jgi:hypothetical protein
MHYGRSTSLSPHKNDIHQLGGRGDRSHSLEVVNWHDEFLFVSILVEGPVLISILELEGSHQKSKTK